MREKEAKIDREDTRRRRKLRSFPPSHSEGARINQLVKHRSVSSRWKDDVNCSTSIRL
jgi:hypothetical protein